MIKKIFLSLFFSGFFFPISMDAKEPAALVSPLSSIPKASEENDEGVVSFTPPPGWNLADASTLPPHVRAMVVGKSHSHFPPSMNLSSEPYQGTLRQYLKIVKKMNSAQGYEWKDLGNIRTEAGNGNLSQVDTKTQWGETRLMHVILLKNKTIYILTASALKEEFSIFYKDFFTAMRSLKVAPDLYEMIDNPQQHSQLKTAVKDLKAQWQTIVMQTQQKYPEMTWKEIQEKAFKGEDFQNTHWIPFEKMLNQKYIQLSSEWRFLFLQKLEDQLFNMKP